MKLDIDSREVVLFTTALERMGKTALPMAVKGALNKAAVSMKLDKKLIEKEFDDNFIVRRPTFIKSHTGFNKVDNAQLNIAHMQSSAGIIKGKTKAGDQLQLQEEGGSLKRRQVPTQYTRIGERNESKQKAQYYFKKYKHKKLGVVMRNKRLTVIKTRRNLLAITKGGTWKTLYSLVPNVKIKKKPFISSAGLIAGRDINRYYINEAERRVKMLRFK